MSLDEQDWGDSSDEGDEDDDRLVDCLVKNYIGTQNNTDEDVESVRSKLLERLNFGSSDAQICLICLESVGKRQAIWSCRTCYEIYHLVCAQKWSAQALQVSEMREEKVVWHCPKCRHEYGPQSRPSKYLCFCGSVPDPKPDNWTAPHSCGDACGRSLGSCKHKCLLLCHPGPCPPCPKVVLVSCFCSSSKPLARRCGNQGWSCSKICNKSLNCAVHKCKAVCHSGSCNACEAKSKRSCRCGKLAQEKPCSDGDWACEEICNKTIDCGVHECKVVCHNGVCPPCVSEGTNSCPCGKQTYTSVGCVDDLPCCGDTCAKLLDCQTHECYQQCHRGPCPPCVHERDKVCRCGLKHRTYPCSKVFLCDTKCRRKRQCGRHACSRRCCDGQCPPCEATCGRTLPCGRHKCSSPCHPGNCYPCTEIAQVTCKCGSTVIRVPCGRQKRVAPPRCRKQCQTPPDCHHSSREPHRCHFGRCPPCTQKCNQTMKCGHKCPIPCHSALLMDTNRPKDKPATPWERPAPKIEMVSLACPPCREPVPKKCRGGHETGSFACSQLRDYSCGRVCAAVLKCNNHLCEKECHQVSGDCDECNELCSQPRPDGCTHKCTSMCHPGPCAPCPQMVTPNCHCALNKIYVPCTEWQKLSPSERSDRLSCGNQCPKLMSCGHGCLLTCHLGECSGMELCKKRVTVACKCGKRTEKRLCNTVKNADFRLECGEKCKTNEPKIKKTKELETESTDTAPSTTSLVGPKRIRKKKEKRENSEKHSILKTVIDNYFYVICAVLVPVCLWVLYANFG